MPHWIAFKKEQKGTKLLSAVTICCLTVGLSVASALAQQTVANDCNKKTNPQTTNAKFDGQLVRGSNVVGADLYNTTGENIGQVNDIVFDETPAT